uniref:hypothetical protein n=1 Tax=Methanoculleus sp. UBA312 TaxID=1915499 RepID=UPI0031B9DC02
LRGEGVGEAAGGDITDAGTTQEVVVAGIVRLRGEGGGIAAIPGVRAGLRERGFRVFGRAQQGVQGAVAVTGASPGRRAEVGLPDAVSSPEGVAGAVVHDLRFFLRSQGGFGGSFQINHGDISGAGLAP